MWHWSEGELVRDLVSTPQEPVRAAEPVVRAGSAHPLVRRTFYLCVLCDIEIDVNARSYHESGETHQENERLDQEYRGDEWVRDAHGVVVSRRAWGVSRIDNQRQALKYARWAAIDAGYPRDAVNAAAYVMVKFIANNEGRSVTP